MRDFQKWFESVADMQGMGRELEAGDDRMLGPMRDKLDDEGEDPQNLDWAKEAIEAVAAYAQAWESQSKYSQKILDAIYPPTWRTR